jgi:hypothetical protein
MVYTWYIPTILVYCDLVGIPDGQEADSEAPSQQCPSCYGSTVFKFVYLEIYLVYLEIYEYGVLRLVQGVRVRFPDAAPILTACRLAQTRTRAVGPPPPGHQL